VAKQILIAAAQQKISSPQLTALARGNVTIKSQTYRDGKVSGGLNAVIPPLLFLLIFYVSIILLGNQMLSSTLEEKENRVTEMILTTLNPTTLIIGKVISLFMVGLMQMLIFALPVIIGYLFFRSNLSLPDLDLSHLSLEPGPMIVGALLLLGGFILFTGTLVAVGAVMPTVKEAGPIFASLMVLIFVPFYVVSLIVSDPHALIVQIFTYFPYSAPVTAMLRNGFGSLTPLESATVIAELFILGFIALRLAVHLFRYGFHRILQEALHQKHPPSPQPRLTQDSHQRGHSPFCRPCGPGDPDDASRLRRQTWLMVCRCDAPALRHRSREVNRPAANTA